MEPVPFLPTPQSMTSTPAFIFPQSLQGPSSLGPQPNPQHHLPDATNLLEWGLPPNTSRVLAEHQASGRLPGPFNGPAGQPVRTAKTVAAAKHKTVRRNSQQPHMWKVGCASTIPRAMPPPRQVSQLPMVSQPQLPPAKARARRGARAARPRRTTTDFSRQPSTTTPSRREDEESAPQQRYIPTSAAQAVAPQVEVTPSSTHAGPSGIAGPSAASWEEGVHGGGQSTPDWGLLSWATATAAQISHRCGLGRLPVDLIEQVLPSFRAYLKKSGPSEDARTCQTSPTHFPTPVASPLPQDPWPPRMSPMEHPVPALTTVALRIEESTGPESWSMMGCSTWVPEPESSLMAERLLTYEELEAARLQEQDGVVLEKLMEEGPSAALEFILDIEHSQAVRAGREEYPFASPTYEEIERPLCLPSNTHFSTELAQGAGMGGMWTGGLDGWEGYGELEYSGNM